MRSDSFLSMPPFDISNSFLCLEAKNISDHVIIRIKRIYNYLTNKANIYLSYISESITRIIGNLYMSALCMGEGAQRAVYACNT